MLFERIALVIAAIVLCGSVQPEGRFEGAGE